MVCTPGNDKSLCCFKLPDGKGCTGEFNLAVVLAANGIAVAFLHFFSFLIEVSGGDAALGDSHTYGYNGFPVGGIANPTSLEIYIRFPHPWFLDACPASAMPCRPDKVNVKVNKVLENKAHPRTA